MTVIPTVLYVVAGLLVWNYPINKELHERIVDEIAERGLSLNAD
jgi:Na+/melibiose symporter-like transporter